MRFEIARKLASTTYAAFRAPERVTECGLGLASLRLGQALTTLLELLRGSQSHVRSDDLSAAKAATDFAAKI